MNFDQAFDRLIGNEGGYVNNPADPGGETQWGISKRAYPNVNIRDLTREQAKAIYRRDVWQRASLD
ncbi:glycosyl hydrolase 108 family protein, partial [Acinetobacter baumannii]